MADLSTLDQTLPADTDQASTAASRERETRAALLGWAVVEHLKTGVHAFLSGNQGARPAAGNNGRIYLNTTDNRVERDNGSAWNMLHAVQPYTQFSASNALTTGGLGIDPNSDVVPGGNTIFTQAVDVLAGGWVILLASLLMPTAVASAAVDVRFQRDGVTLNPGIQRVIANSAVASGMAIAADNSAAVGSHNYTLSICTNTTPIKDIFLLVLVV